MLGFLRELLELAREEGLSIYRWRREHPDVFLKELTSRRAAAKGRLRRKWLDGRIERWKMRAEAKARE